MHFEQMKRVYTQSAIILLNTVVLLVLVNGVSGLVIAINNRLRLGSDSGELLSRSGKERLLQAYPGRSEAEVLAILRETWQDISRNGEYEWPTQFKEAAFQGRYVNVDPSGFRMSTPQGPWPPDPANFNIFLLGGSTTFGYGVSDDESLPSAIQHLLSQTSATPVFAYNFGRGAYFSSQELMLYYRLLTSGSVPDMVVFVDGYNDFENLDGEPGYTENLSLLVQEHGWDNSRKSVRDLLTSLPAAQAARWLREHLTLDREEDDDPIHHDEATLARVRDRWLTNKGLIEKLSAMFKVRSVFVWQPVPYYRYDYKSYHLLRDLDPETNASKVGYSVMARARPELERGDNFLWLADMQEDKHENLYVDDVHYTASFTKEIAARICSFLQQEGFVADPGNQR